MCFSEYKNLCLTAVKHVFKRKMKLKDQSKKIFSQALIFKLTEEQSVTYKRVSFRLSIKIQKSGGKWRTKNVIFELYYQTSISSTDRLKNYSEKSP